ncbi:MAG: hypothetical protein IT370_24130, partial [Deltaproteobacteria bacterium]|nr:hypothetical protein [Deltaproteobacteria bacterium]
MRSALILLLVVGAVGCGKSKKDGADKGKPGPGASQPTVVPTPTPTASGSPAASASPVASAPPAAEVDPCPGKTGKECVDLGLHSENGTGGQSQDLARA